MMTFKFCSSCLFRRHYEKKPRSILGKLWRWHTGWCPGWNRYMESLPQKERTPLAEQLAELDGHRYD